MPRHESSPTPLAGRVVLVTGATGMVGPRVVERFASCGFGVRVLVTKVPARPLFGPKIDLRIGDVADPASASSAVDGVDTIVHMAALLHASQGAGFDREAYHRTNVQGTREMVNAGLRARVRRFVFFSTIAVYGPGNGDAWDECSPVQPDTVYGATKVEAERVVLNALGPDGTPFGVVLRLGAVFGPHLKGNYLRLVRALAARRFVPVGPGTNRRALINDRDVAEGTVLAATHPVAAGRVYNLSDGEEYPLTAVIAAICHALGRRPPRFRLPLAPVRLTVDIVEAMAGLVRTRPPVSRSTLEKYTEDTRIDIKRIREELGFVPRCGLEEGWMEAIATLRQSGQV